MDGITCAILPLCVLVRSYFSCFPWFPHSSYPRKAGIWNQYGVSCPLLPVPSWASLVPNCSLASTLMLSLELQGPRNQLEFPMLLPTSFWASLVSVSNSILFFLSTGMFILLILNHFILSHEDI